MNFTEPQYFVHEDTIEAVVCVEITNTSNRESIRSPIWVTIATEEKEALGIIM